MPEIKQQESTLVNSQTTSSRIVSVKSIPRNVISMVIYGQTKTGKTRLLSSFPKPVLIIATEDGTDSIANVDGVDIVQIKNTDEIGFFADLANKKGYKTAGLDNATQAQQMKLAEMLGLESVPLQHARGVMASIDNQEYSLKSKHMLNEMFRFKGNVVFLAHERNQNAENKSDLISPDVGASLSKQVAEWLNGKCSNIVQTFIREQMLLKQFTDDGEPTPVGTGKGEYCLRTGPHPIYKAGLRVPVGYKCPDFIVNPTYEKIAQILQGKWKEPEQVKQS